MTGGSRPLHSIEVINVFILLIAFPMENFGSRYEKGYYLIRVFEYSGIEPFNYPPYDRFTGACRPVSTGWLQFDIM